MSRVISLISKEKQKKNKEKKRKRNAHPSFGSETTKTLIAKSVSVRNSSLIKQVYLAFIIEPIQVAQARQISTTKGRAKVPPPAERLIARDRKEHHKQYVTANNERSLTFVVADVAEHHLRREQGRVCIRPRDRVRTEQVGTPGGRWSATTPRRQAGTGRRGRRRGTACAYRPTSIMCSRPGSSSRNSSGSRTNNL